MNYLSLEVMKKQSINHRLKKFCQVGQLFVNDIIKRVIGHTPTNPRQSVTPEDNASPFNITSP